MELMVLCFRHLRCVTLVAFALEGSASVCDSRPPASSISPLPLTSCIAVFPGFVHRLSWSELAHQEHIRRLVYVPLSVLDIVGPKDNEAISLV